MTIMVFGSINLDLVTTTPRLPIAGETLIGEKFLKTPGGKGANQAVALAKLAIPTQMIGRVGDDNFGRELLENLKISGVETTNVVIDKNTNSGIAIITVDHQSENHIIVIPGANAKVNQEDIQRLSNILPTATTILLQLEIPIDIVFAAAKTAKDANLTVILDPAPAQTNLPVEIYRLIDIITPNEIEASQLVNFPVNGEETAAKAANILLARGVKCAIIKLGAKGVYCATQTEKFFIPAFPVHAIDTVAAGDAFNAGLAAALFHQKPLREAVVWGAAAGGLATTKLGAQSSLPDKITLEKFLSNSRSSQKYQS